MEEQADLNILTLDTKINVLPPKSTIIFKLLEVLPLNTGTKVLEINPNSIEHLPYLFQKAENTIYFGAGTEPEVKESVLHHKIEDNQIQFTKITDERLDFRNSFFDCCFTVNSIYFWPDPLQYFSEIYRVLKPEGKMHLAFVEKKFGSHLPWTQLDFSFYEIADIKSLFKQSGFTHITVKEMTETVTDTNGKETSRPFILISGEK